MVGSKANATITGAGTTFEGTGNLNIGTSGTASFTIGEQAAVRTDALSINNLSALHLDGGTIRFNGFSNAGTVNYASGTVQLAGPRTIGTDAAVATFFGASPTIRAGKRLVLEFGGQLKFGAGPSVDGGNLTSESGFFNISGVMTVINRGTVVSSDMAIGTEPDTGGLVNIRGAESVLNVVNLALAVNSSAHLNSPPSPATPTSTATSTSTTWPSSPRTTTPPTASASGARATSPTTATSTSTTWR